MTYTIKHVTVSSTDTKIHLLILVPEDPPDHADRDTEHGQQQHPDLRALVEIRQVVVWDSGSKTHQSYSCLCCHPPPLQTP